MITKIYLVKMKKSLKYYYTKGFSVFKILTKLDNLKAK